MTAHPASVDASAVRPGDRLDFQNLPHCCSTKMRLFCIGLGGIWVCRTCIREIYVDGQGYVTEPGNQ